MNEIIPLKNQKDQRPVLILFCGVMNICGLESIISKSILKIRCEITKIFYREDNEQSKNLKQLDDFGHKGLKGAYKIKTVCL